MTQRTRLKYRRRSFIRALGAGGVAAMTGCLGTDENEDGGEDWQSQTLEDTTTGTEFHIGDFENPVIVHTFAANCLTCARQQTEFRVLWDQRDDFEIVELSIDPNDTPEDLTDHAEAAGLEWRVGVAPESVTGQLVDEFGQAVTVSAQSPIIIVCPDGTTDTLSKIAGPDEIESTIEDAC